MTQDYVSSAPNLQTDLANCLPKVGTGKLILKCEVSFLESSIKYSTLKMF